jgi:hypothetical protein
MLKILLNLQYLVNVNPEGEKYRQKASEHWLAIADACQSVYSEELLFAIGEYEKTSKKRALEASEKLRNPITRIDYRKNKKCKGGKESETKAISNTNPEEAVVNTEHVAVDKVHDDESQKWEKEVGEILKLVLK